MEKRSHLRLNGMMVRISRVILALLKLTVNVSFAGKPLPPQNMVSLKQAAGVILYTALNRDLRG